MPATAANIAPDHIEQTPTVAQIRDHLAAALLAILEAPGDQRALTAGAQAIQQHRQFLGDKQLLMEDTIRSWEVAEGSADDFAPDQVKPWTLKIERTGCQVAIALWPGEQEEINATEGMGVFLEINKGRPALHVGTAPYEDAILHIHGIEQTLEVVPDCHGDMGVSGPSEIYSAANAIVYGA